MSIFESAHPFSISGFTDTIFTIDIQVSGNWTRKLAAHVRTSQGMLTASIDPFLGQSCSLNSLDRPLVLIAGGIGCTPMMSELASVQRAISRGSIPQHPIKFVWMLRDLQLLDLYLALLIQLDQADTVQISVYITRLDLESEMQDPDMSSLSNHLPWQDCNFGPVSVCDCPNRSTVWCGTVVAVLSFAVGVVLARLSREPQTAEDHLFTWRLVELSVACVACVIVVILALRGMRNNEHSAESSTVIHSVLSDVSTPTASEATTVIPEQMLVNEEVCVQQQIRSVCTPSFVTLGERANISSYLSECKEVQTLVSVCGPSAMKEEVATHCGALKLDLHNHEFKW